MPRKSKSFKPFLLNTGRIKLPTCPLCLNKMAYVFDRSRGVFVFVCHIDLIGIHVNDRFVGKWDEAYEKVVKDEGKIMCPAGCGMEARYFCTSTGFMKAKCPRARCRAAMQSTDLVDAPTPKIKGRA